MNRITPFLAVALLSVATVAGAQDRASSQIDLTFADIEQPKGRIMVALFDSEAGYRSGKSARSVVVAADAASVTTVIADLKPGRYAIKSFHDVDGDGKMGTNPFGLPVEPYAFSNNAHGSAGPATWADAAFAVAAGKTVQRIVIR